MQIPPLRFGMEKEALEKEELRSDKNNRDDVPEGLSWRSGKRAVGLTRKEERDYGDQVG